MSTTLCLNDSPSQHQAPDRSEAAPWGWVDRTARKLLVDRLMPMQGGTIELTDALGTVQLGSEGDLRSRLQVHRPQFFRHAVLGGSLSEAESYLRGD